MHPRADLHTGLPGRFIVARLTPQPFHLHTTVAVAESRFLRHCQKRRTLTIIPRLDKRREGERLVVGHRPLGCLFRFQEVVLAVERHHTHTVFGLHRWGKLPGLFPGSHFYCIGAAELTAQAAGVLDAIDQAAGLEIAEIHVDNRFAFQRLAFDDRCRLLQFRHAERLVIDRHVVEDCGS